ncbi:flavodoxin family protein [Brumicola nitratireducens]|uniref:Flavodoxin-like domain-containing protein n=1 Tax=Glaciecola nitratireducens (strain JCM 12485 / KCTC 12276 / FR1064) TaxID=1085623 RepID=G4QFN8_GLANF|nr:hypothetical protein [Glaciecola nitratireducens]AEP28823.1 hypothetical protein GNIT_0679 [Glaciecola nitratireducens FR1064]
MKTMIVYYSLSGNTKKLGDFLATKLSADKTQIEERSKNTNFFTMLRLMYQVLLNKPSKIRSFGANPSQYDLIILGTPVWMTRLSSPVRAFINQEKSHFKKIAFFCTESSSGGNAVFKSMSELCGQQPIATLEMTRSDMVDLNNNQKLSDFIDVCRGRIEECSTGAVDHKPHHMA